MKSQTTKIHQLLRLITLLQSGRAGGADQIAQELAVSVRTFHRYLKTLAHVGIPCYHDPELKAYKIRKDFFFPPVHLTASETLALALLAEEIAGKGQIALTTQATTAIEKVLTRLPESTRRDIGITRERLGIRLSAPDASGEAIKDIFGLFQESMKTGLALQCRYDSLNPDSDGQEWFQFEPYTLTFDQHSWYAVGFHAGRKEVRQLKLVRLAQVKPTQSPYRIPADFSLDKHRALAWRMIRGDTRHDITIIFQPPMADTVEETHWHPTQSTTWNDDGTLTFKCQVDGLDEVTWWVLGYGPSALVLEPPELVNRIKHLATQTAQRYRPKT